jgi:hypothetical protein
MKNRARQQAEHSASCGYFHLLTRLVLQRGVTDADFAVISDNFTRD